ncbi:MAG: rhomboid family intramembrane serine protease [Bacteroidales bacterium]|nr:rhomboid family intramembrane serine protease [Bacteroidales bacterium]
MNYNNPYNNYYQQRPSFNLWQNIKQFFQSKSWLSRLIAINIIVWLAVVALKYVIAWLFMATGNEMQMYVMKFLALPAYLPNLLVKPWTLISYMFLHFDFMHILFNMLWLYWFGKIFLEFLSDRQLVSVYFWGGLASAALYIAAFNLFPVFQQNLEISYLLGASGAVMAIVAATAFYVPNYRLNLLFIGPVKLIYFALIYFAIDFLTIPNGNAGGNLAHIGGAIWGIVYAFQLKNGRAWIHVIEQKIKNIFTRKPKIRIKQKTNKGTEQAAQMNDAEYNKAKKREQEAIDKILDKISQHGYDALSKEEKEQLFKAK